MSDSTSKKSLLPQKATDLNLNTTPVELRWVELCTSEDTLVDGLYPFDISKDDDDFPILLLRVNGSLYALHDECPHRRIRISESGYLDGDNVHCGWHHWGFSIHTGEHTVPTGVCVNRFEVREEEGKISLGIPW